MHSSPGRPHCCGVGRKPTSPAQRQETRTTWAASEPCRHLAPAPKAARLGSGSGSLAARHGAPGPVLCPLFAKRGGGERGPPSVCVCGGVSPFGSAAPVLQCPKGEAATRAPALSSSFCRESAAHPSSGTCPGSGCPCPAVMCARNKGSSWAVARCLRPGPRSQTRPRCDRLCWGLQPPLLCGEEGSCSFHGGAFSSSVPRLPTVVLRSFSDPQPGSWDSRFPSLKQRLSEGEAT